MKYRNWTVYYRNVDTVKQFEKRAWGALVQLNFIKYPTLLVNSLIKDKV